MCEQCVKAKAELFPDATHEQFMGILWNHTCFPFGDAAQVRKHLEEYVRDLKTLADYGYGKGERPVDTADSIDQNQSEGKPEPLDTVEPSGDNG